MEPKSSVFLFPGQGVISSDVCFYFLFLKKFNENKTFEYLNLAQKSLDEINPKAKFDLNEILNNDRSPAFQKTSCVQVITLTLSLLTHFFLKEKSFFGYTPKIMLGHSLGAVSALIGAESLSLQEGLEIIAQRGKLMQEASEISDTGMVVILGLAKEQIEKICELTKTSISLINGPKAIVVGGEKIKLLDVGNEAKKLGAIKTIQLQVSGAFHTEAMQSAYEKFDNFLLSYEFKMPKVPVVTNIQKKLTSDPGELKKDILESIINPINWVGMMENVKSAGVDFYIEVGPGTSLSSLSKINGVNPNQILHARTLLEA